MGRCYTLDNKLVIPDTIEGLPVTELDTYTFSQTVRRREQPPAEYEGEPEMCGEALEELTLPKQRNRCQGSGRSRWQCRR